MNSKYLAFIEDLISQERMIKLNENRYYENDISEELKCENENKIKLCDEILRELIKLWEKQLFFVSENDSFQNIFLTKKNDATFNLLPRHPAFSPIYIGFVMVGSHFLSVSLMTLVDFKILAPEKLFF